LEVRDLDALFEQFADHALAVLDHSPLTVRNYRYAYRIFRRYLLDPSIAGGAPGERMFQLNGWVAWNRKRNISRYTVNMYWRALRAFFKYLESEAGIQNPFHGMPAPGLPERQSKALERNSLHRILDAARRYPWSSRFLRERAIAILATLMYTGLRKRELLNLRLDDEESVNLASGWIKVLGKGRHGGTERFVYAPDALQSILRIYVAERNRQGVATDALFTSRQGNPLSEMQFRRVLQTVRRASGVKFSAHVLRHSFITLFHLNGTPLGVVQAAAGHARLETTAGYLSVRNEDLRQHSRSFRI
jgi:site-specific recombinase XerD